MTLQVKLIDIQQNALNEASQTTQSTFAMVKQLEDGSFINTTPIMRCRDYFNDMMYVQHHPDHKLGEQYGFKWEYDEELAEQLRKRQQIFLLFNYGENYDNWNPLTNLENNMHFSSTKLLDVEITDNEVKDKCFDNFVILEVDPRWFSSSIMLSLYTMYVRLLGYAEEDSVDYYTLCNAIKTHTTDADFINMVVKEYWTNLDYVHNNWRTLFGEGVGQPINESDIDTGEGELSCVVHNGSGILSYIQGIHSRIRSSVEPAVRGWVDNYKVLYVIPQVESSTHVEATQEATAETIYFESEEYVA